MLRLDDFLPELFANLFQIIPLFSVSFLNLAQLLIELIHFLLLLPQVVLLGSGGFTNFFAVANFDHNFLLLSLGFLDKFHNLHFPALIIMIAE